MINLDDELEAIMRGVVDVLPSKDVLVTKLRKSHEENRPLRVKLGIDPTGTSIHFGHMIPLWKLKQFQDLGHHTILIIGTFTGMVGDPEGRKVTRPQLSREQILANAETMTQHLQKVIDPQKTEIVRNGDWLNKFTAMDGINLAKKVTLARLIERHDFGSRLEQGIPIHLHEIIYPLLMGYDSVHLMADIELGATEQMLNIYMGRFLQEAAGQEPQVGMILPVLEGLDGKEKMSKSLNNFIGIDEDPKVMYEKILSIPDKQIKMYFTLLTTISEKEIHQIEIEMANETISPQLAKKKLAYELISTFYSMEIANQIML